MSRLRISAISYLNTAPLMWDFENGESAEALKEHFDFSYTIPSECAEQLKIGAADIGIIPVATYTTIPDLAIIPDVAIAAKDSVRSILLVSKVPLEKIRSVAVDTSSRTSAALVQIFLKKFVGVNPGFIPTNFFRNICTSAAEVREEVSTATLRIFSSGTLLTSRMDRTLSLAAMATSGMIARSGIVV